MSKNKEFEVEVTTPHNNLPEKAVITVLKELKKNYKGMYYSDGAVLPVKVKKEYCCKVKK